MAITARTFVLGATGPVDGPTGAVDRNGAPVNAGTCGPGIGGNDRMPSCGEAIDLTTHLCGVAGDHALTIMAGSGRVRVFRAVLDRRRHQARSKPRPRRTQSDSRDEE
jgi:hypothetical protein